MAKNVLWHIIRLGDEHGPTRYVGEFIGPDEETAVKKAVTHEVNADAGTEVRAYQAWPAGGKKITARRRPEVFVDLVPPTVRKVV